MVNKYSNTLILSLIVSIFIGGCGSSSDRNPTEQPTLKPPVNLEQAKALARKEANVHPKIDFKVKHVTDSELSHLHFEGYYFLYVWGPMGHTQSSSFAIAPDGSAFKLPEEFNSLAKHADLYLNTPEEALGILEFYLNFHSVWPGTDYQKIIGRLLDIPGIDNQDEETETSLPNVSPLKIFNNTTGWAVDFYTWRAINGVLFKWEVTISRDGTFQTERISRIDEKVGNFLSIE